MKASSDVYCVKCATIVPREQAEQIFKTGFYKITTPLAVCTNCANGESEKIHIEIEHVGFNEVIYGDIQSVI
jgi:hypothetical protein